MTFFKWKYMLFVALGIVSIAATQHKNESLNGRIFVDNEFLNELCNMSKDTLYCEDTAITLTADVWRNMGAGDPIYSGLIVLNRLNAKKSFKSIETWKLKQQFVIYKDTIWESVYDDAIGQWQEFGWERIARFGPNWPTRQIVDVVCVVQNTQWNTEHYLIKRNVRIGCPS